MKMNGVTDGEQGIPRPGSQQPTANSQQPRPGSQQLTASSQQPRGLGRGLGALIPRGQPGLQEIEVDRIAPNPQQPRLRVDEAALAELTESLRQHGVLQPVIVTRHDAGEGYLLIAGERRWRAAQQAGLKTIPAVVKEAAPRQRLELALVENLQREDLAPLETATAYRVLIEEHALTQDQVAQQVGKSRVSVSNTLRLLQLPRPAREALAAGKIAEGHARALLGAPSETTLLVALDQVLAHGLTVRQTEELIRRGTEHVEVSEQAETSVEQHGPDRREPLSDTPETAYLEERFRQALGTKVELVHGRRGGRLIIHFYSDDELAGLYETIVGE
jgi:ParB family chromosome partitioning protein